MGSSLELQRQLLRRLQRVVRQWPEDPSKKGRDLGEFLRKNYVKRFEEELKKNPSHAEMAVSSLERLSSDFHRKQYPREKEYSYSEGLVTNHPSALSNENLSDMRKRSRTLWQKLTGR